MWKVHKAIRNIKFWLLSDLKQRDYEHLIGLDRLRIERFLSSLCFSPAKPHFPLLAELPTGRISQKYHLAILPESQKHSFLKHRNAEKHETSCWKKTTLASSWSNSPFPFIWMSCSAEPRPQWKWCKHSAERLIHLKKKKKIGKKIRFVSWIQFLDDVALVGQVAFPPKERKSIENSRGAKGKKDEKEWEIDTEEGKSIGTKERKLENFAPSRIQNSEDWEGVQRFLKDAWDGGDRKETGPRVQNHRRKRISLIIGFLDICKLWNCGCYDSNQPKSSARHIT